MYDNLSDEELMVMYQNGTQEAFSTLYKRHSAKIYGYVKSKVRGGRRGQGEQLAHDIFQDIFVKIHRSKHLYNKSFRVLPWIFTIARSVVIDEMRKNQNVALVSEEKLEQLAGTDAASAEAGASAATGATHDLAPQLKDLPEAQRRAVEERFINEKTFEEIAESLKTSPANVRQLVSRGVKKLRAALKAGAEK